MRAFKQRDLSGKRLLWIALLLFLAGVLNDPPWKWYSSAQHVAYVGEAEKVAGSLYHGRGFSDPFGVMDTGPTAHVAPAYPFLQSLLLRGWGDHAAGWLALRILPTVALSLQFALLPYCARLFGYSAWIGVLASIFGLIVKPGKEEHWEAHLAGLAALLLTAGACRWMERPGVWIGLVTGVTAGLAILMQPVIALVYVAWLLYIGRRGGLWLWAIPLLLCTPWMIRNKTVLGFTGIRDNLGTELHVSFNDCAPYGVRESEKQFCYEPLHPNTSLEEAKAVRAMGEYEYNQNRLRQAILWIAGHPARAAILAGERIWFFWFPSDAGWSGYLGQRKRTLAGHFLTAASILGLLLSVRRRIRGAFPLALWVILYPVIYYLVKFEVRYRYPILWVTWLTGAYAVAYLWQWTRVDKMEPAAGE